jgi:hypothetical protein
VDVIALIGAQTIQRGVASLHGPATVKATAVR